MLSEAVDMINGIRGTMERKTDNGEKRGTNNNISYVFSPVTSTKENHKSIWKSYRPAGSLTYCISVG